jgi:hypothetical protein
MRATQKKSGGSEGRPDYLMAGASRYCLHCPNVVAFNTSQLIMCQSSRRQPTLAQGTGVLMRP